LAHAQQRLNLSRESGRDAPELRLGWRQAQGARGAEREGALLIGVRIPLEADRRNGVALAEAQAGVHQAERERARLHEQLTAAVQLAQAALAGAQMQADSRATQRRLLRERATWLERAFQAGETALPDLLRALAAAAQADAAHHQSQVALGLARARLHQSLGLVP
jgi:outer membrane protein TolC